MPRKPYKANAVNEFNVSNPRQNLRPLPAVVDDEEAMAIYNTLEFIIFNRYPNAFLTEADSFTVSNIALQLSLYNQLMADAMKTPILETQKSHSADGVMIKKENPAYTLASKAWKSAEASLKLMSLNPKARMTLLSMARYIESDHGSKKDGDMKEWLKALDEDDE